MDGTKQERPVLVVAANRISKPSLMLDELGKKLLGEDEWNRLLEIERNK